jgi:hypothetical protein
VTPQLEGALDVARLGGHVFRVWGVAEGACRCQQGPDCDSPGKHPVQKDWQRHATSDPARIRGWAASHPDENFGYRTDDLPTVDVDPRNGGSLRNLPKPWPKVRWIVGTGGGGWHIVYHAKGTPVRGGQPFTGVDVKGKGGLAVCPGSMHASGERYEWFFRPDAPEEITFWPNESPWGEQPELKLEARESAPKTDSAYGLAALESEAEALARTPVGRRNNQLNVAALKMGHLVASGNLSEATARTRLLDAAREAGLERREAEATFRSGFSAGVKEPRGPARPPKGPDGVESDLSDAAWAPLDLGRYADSPPTPPERFGPGKLFYRGCVHWLAGEPESGKSTLVYAAAIEEMRSGRTVLVLDEDAGPLDVSERLSALGATPGLIRERFVYLPPGGRDLFRETDRLVALVTDRTPSLLIVDAAADHLEAAAKDEDKARDVTAFINRALKPLAQRRGVAIAVIDHVTKADPRGRYGRGSSSKLAKADVGYNVSAPEPFSRERSGRIHIVCTKDRPGYIGRETSWMVRVVVADDGASLRLDAGLPLTPEETRKIRSLRSGKETADEIVGVLADQLLPMTMGEILAALPTRLSRNRVSAILNELKREGVVDDSAGELANQKQWRLVGDA